MMMKKMAIPLLLGVAAAAQAQTTVTIYGRIDNGLVMIKPQDGGRSYRLDSALTQGSRWGLRGSEDLGGGLKANFQLESGINTDTGTLGQGGRGFGRQSWVGLSGGFGAVKFGRFPVISDTVLAVGDAYNGVYGVGDIAGIARATFPLRLDNSAQYTTPTFGGFTGYAGYTFGERTSNTQAGSASSAGATYAAGPLEVGVSYEHFAKELYGGNRAEKLRNVAAAYDFGIFKLHAVATSEHNTVSSDGTDRGFLLGLGVPLGKGIFNASVTRKVLGVTDDDIHAFNVAYTYPLSKRTVVYGYGGKARGGRLGALTSAQLDRFFDHTSLSDRTEVGFGLRHSF